jgi:hypothetical protein
MSYTYISKARRDAKYRELKARGEDVHRSSIRNQQLHPEYITDAAEEGITYQTGFGNTDYLRMWSVLYTIERPYRPARSSWLHAEGYRRF